MSGIELNTSEIESGDPINWQEPEPVEWKAKERSSHWDAVERKEDDTNGPKYTQ